MYIYYNPNKENIVEFMSHYPIETQKLKFIVMDIDVPFWDKTAKYYIKDGKLIRRNISPFI